MNKRLSRAFGIFFLLVELSIVPKAIELMLNQHFSELSPVRIIALSMTFGSIALCILMSFSSLSEHESYPLHTFFFELMTFMCCLAPMTDLVSRALDSSNMPRLNMLVNTVFYLIGINVTYVIMQYEFLVIGNAEKPLYKAIKKAAGILVLADNLATLLNMKLGYFFTVNESGTYQSAPTFWISYIPPAAVVAATAFIAARELKPGRQRRAFLSFWIFALLSCVLQVWHEELSVQYTGYTLSIIVIYLNIQSELDDFCLPLLEKGKE